ncbi:MAG: Zn-dependent hydrolase [Flavobacteriaceae bacterium]|nr:Zn-dependent hydrolase [Flavobacteriaceae bacterium]MDZ4147325.1 Zn-dependent hydrolase [Flavobacteriaceae bacterium]
MKKVYSAILLFLVLSHFSFAQEKISADANRVESRIFALAEFGKNPQGGVSRISFSEADLQGRQYIIQLMKQLGLEVQVDAAANIIGRRSGKDNSLPVIAFGSHIDSVPMGGNYDGDVGVIGALECIELLNEHNLVTEHPLEVIVFSDEEGGLTGSKALSGELHTLDLEKIAQSGKSVREGVNFLGGDVEKIASVVRKKGAIAAFLELHIEQGARLYQSKTDIGVVEGIVGIGWWDMTFQGKANHAGTTPMNARQDALLAASKLIVQINEIVRNIEGSQVATVGRIKAEPGAPNVIPGKVVASLEIRDLSNEKIQLVFEKIKEAAKVLEAESGVSIAFTEAFLSSSALTDQAVQKVIADNAKKLGLSLQYMPSGAGHDTQDMARIAPSGMIFVPSKDGVSHAPDEFTSASDMANGATVLFQSILTLDRAKK